MIVSFTDTARATAAEGGIQVGFRRLRRALRRRFLRGRATAKLHGLSNAALRDIGLSRTDLQLTALGLPHRARPNRDL